jgi:hypothetical protein
MKLTVGLLCFLAIVVAIVAPPVVKNAPKNKGNAKSDDEEDAEDVVARDRSLAFAFENPFDSF